MSVHKKPKYVFLITIDALRADYVGCIGGGNLTPNIDKIAKESLLYTRAFANGPGTNQSFPAIMTSTYFLMNNGFRLSSNYKTLAEIMNKSGFKTVAFHSNPFLSKIFGWDRGFDEFYDFMEDLKSPSAFVTRQQKNGFGNRVFRFLTKYIGGSNNLTIRQFLKKIYYKYYDFKMPYFEGKELNKKVFCWIEKNLNKSFFLWMHYMDPHHPYIPPINYCEQFSSRKEEFTYNTSVDYNNISFNEMSVLKSLYEGEVRYVDFCIGKLIGFIEEKDLIDDSMIIITADHGESLMEHKKLGHKPDVLYNEVLHVPLLIYGMDFFCKINNPVQLLDISPTILDFLCIKKPVTFLGKSLLLSSKNHNLHRPIFSESAKPDLINLKYDKNVKAVSCIKEDWKLIINDLLNTKELYDMKNDFKEKHNVTEKECGKSEKLTKMINKHLLMIKQKQK